MKSNGALESITANKASGCDGIPADLLKILNDDAVKVLYSISQQIWKTQQWHGIQDFIKPFIIRKWHKEKCANDYQLDNNLEV